jgi:hypothetical protein
LGDYCRHCPLKKSPVFVVPSTTCVHQLRSFLLAALLQVTVLAMFFLRLCFATAVVAPVLAATLLFHTSATVLQHKSLHRRQAPSPDSSPQRWSPFRLNEKQGKIVDAYNEWSARQATCLCDFIKAVQSLLPRQLLSLLLPYNDPSASYVSTPFPLFICLLRTQDTQALVLSLCAINFLILL